MLQASAFLHGHTWIDLPNCCIEHAQYRGKYYQLHPPLPAILLLPFVAISGTDTNQTIACVTIAALSVALAWLMLGRMKVTLNARVWLTIFFGAGTILWHEAADGGSWELSMVVAVAFTMAGLAEFYGDARPGVIGLTAGLAALARYDLAFVWPVWTLLTYLKRPALRELLWLVPGFVFAALIYAGFNEVRYGSLFDRGVFLMEMDIPHKFSIHYLPTNVYTLFFMAPSLSPKFPYIHPEGGGQALSLDQSRVPACAASQLSESYAFRFDGRRRHIYYPESALLHQRLCPIRDASLCSRISFSVRFDRSRTTGRKDGPADTLTDRFFCSANRVWSVAYRHLWIRRMRIGKLNHLSV